MKNEKVFMGRRPVEDIIQQYEDATADSEYQKIGQELNDRRISLQQLRDENMGCGLWKPVGWDNTSITMEKYEDHPLAEENDIDKWEGLIVSSDKRKTNLAKQGKVDTVKGKVINDPGNTPLDEVRTVPTGAQINLRFNFKNDHLANRPVRQAFAYALDNKKIIRALEQGKGITSGLVDVQNGSSSQIQDNFMDDSVLDSFIDYGVSGDTDTAEKILKDAGYSRNGDGIFANDDGPLEFDHKIPPWSPYGFVSKLIAEELQDFGISLQPTVLSSNGWGNTWWSGYDFDVATYFQSGSHPASWYGLSQQGGGLGYYQSAVDSEKVDPNSCSTDTPPLSSDTTERLNMPIHPEYPEEIGATGGSMKQLNPFQLINRMQAAESTDELTDLLHEMAWYINYQVPHVGLYDEIDVLFGNTEEFSYPTEESHPAVYNTKTWFQTMNSSGIQPKK
jgi:ABC-type transport system substrate-binding protein